MACSTKNIKFQLRRDTAANWKIRNPRLLDGEPGIETDSHRIKVGDGVHYWNDLPYSSQTIFYGTDSSHLTPNQIPGIGDLFLNTATGELFVWR